jgi:hypothetical protein
VTGCLEQYQLAAGNMCVHIFSDLAGRYNVVAALKYECAGFDLLQIATIVGFESHARKSLGNVGISATKAVG